MLKYNWESNHRPSIQHVIFRTPSRSFAKLSKSITVLYLKKIYICYWESNTRPSIQHIIFRTSSQSLTALSNSTLPHDERKQIAKKPRGIEPKTLNPMSS